MELTPATVPPFAGDPYPDLHRLSYQFLQNIKVSHKYISRLAGALPISPSLTEVQVRFGEDSASSIAIHNVLGDFAAGSVSKRETFLTIWDRLRDHEDLRHELDALLRHDHARWSPQDFRPLQNTTILHVPDFLQPQHEPSLPVPRFSNGAASSSALQCASDPVMDPALLHSPFEPTQPAIGNESLNLMPERSTNHHGHDGGPIALSPHSYAPVPPSPATESQFHVSPFTQHTPLAMSWQQVHSYPSYVDYTGVAAHEGHTSQLDMTPHLQHSQYHAEGWSSSPHATPDVQSTFRQEHVGGYHTSPQAVSHDSTLQSTPSNRSYYFDNHVPVQETVPAPPHGNPLLDPDLRFAHPFSIHNQSHQHGPGEPGRVGESGEQLPGQY